MGNNAVEGLAKIAILIENGKATEKEIIDGLGCMISLRATGLHTNWGFNAFADNYEKFMGNVKPGSVRVQLRCVVCGNGKDVAATAVKDNRNCACGGRFEREDDA